MSHRSVLEPPDPPKEKKDKSQKWGIEIPTGVINITISGDYMLLDILQPSQPSQKNKDG